MKTFGQKDTFLFYILLLLLLLPLLLPLLLLLLLLLLLPSAVSGRATIQKISFSRQAALRPPSRRRGDGLLADLPRRHGRPPGQRAPEPPGDPPGPVAAGLPPPPLPAERGGPGDGAGGAAGPAGLRRRLRRPGSAPGPGGGGLAGRARRLLLPTTLPRIFIQVHRANSPFWPQINYQHQCSKVGQHKLGIFGHLSFPLIVWCVFFGCGLCGNLKLSLI